MKKNLWMAALVGVALTGCVSEEVSPVENQAKALTFAAPVMKTQSRANVLGEIGDNTGYPVGEQFKVYAWSYKGAFNESTFVSSDTKPYFKNEGDVATNETGSMKWATATSYYWPVEDYNLLFAAYSPASFVPVVSDPSTVTSFEQKVAYDSKGLKVTDFVVQKNSNYQYDLMYSDRVLDRNKTNNGTDAVKIVFNHALSSIVFSAEKPDENFEYKILDLTVTGPYEMKASFTQGIVKDGTVTSSYAEKSVPTWTLPVQNADKIIFDGTFEPNFDPYNVTTTPLQFTKGASALLLIPQVVPANAKVKIKYSQQHKVQDGVDAEGNPKYKLEGEALETTKEINLLDFKFTENSEAKSVTEWLPGHRYIYRFSFGANHKIYFEPSIHNWEQHPTAIYTIN